MDFVKTIVEALSQGSNTGSERAFLLGTHGHSFDRGYHPSGGCAHEDIENSADGQINVCCFDIRYWSTRLKYSARRSRDCVVSYRQLTYCIHEFQRSLCFIADQVPLRV